MNRRIALKQMFILAGGISILSSCLSEQGGASIILKHIRITAQEEGFLGNLVEALIPKTDSPGGRELNLHLFVMKMLDDCASPEDQDNFLKGLYSFESKWSTAKQATLVEKLRELEQEQDSAESKFFKILKNRSIQGYLNSEYVMKNQLIYTLIPGKYEAAVKVLG